MITKSPPVIDYPIVPVPGRVVTLEDGFWRPRLETNRRTTIPAILDKCERSGRVDNFRRAAGRLPGSYAGAMPFNDTDVYKAIEGASGYPEFEAQIDLLIELIAEAQEPDGYLYTNRTIDPRAVHPFAGPARWSNLAMSHELYNCGHLYDAACAHHLATGKRSLLEVAVRSAELVRRTFGPAGRHDIPGHPIVETALIRLYRVTGDRGYLETARFLLEERGRHGPRQPYSYAGDPGYCQDHLPVREQREAVGHAVRAVYLYCGMADAAALGPDPAYAEAIEAIWRDVTASRIYLTGGLGALHRGESFGAAFELQNRTAYAETCAAIGSVMWNHRLFLLTGEAKYLDVLEQTLYNGLLSGVSLGGDEFFYPNPLESDGEFAFNYGSAGRQPWFDVSCCPTSLCRFLPSLPGYVYAVGEETIYVNLFIAGRAEVEATGILVDLEQETAYPWSGTVRLAVRPERRTRLKLMIRIPGWAQGSVLAGGLYRFERPGVAPPRLRVNGSTAAVVMERGYAVLDREWAAGDVVELDLPMPVRKVVCDPRVADNRGRAALQRGPLVYCVEGRDAAMPLEEVTLGGESSLTALREPVLLDGVVTVQGPGFRAIPYYAWANRGPGPMRVWLPDAGVKR